MKKIKIVDKMVKKNCKNHQMAFAIFLIKEGPS